MTAQMCPIHKKLAYRSYGAACAAAGAYSTKRDTPLRVYHDASCCSYHLSSRINLRDLVGA
jgi:hypothetical protein